MTPKTAVYAGSFDPLTNGHLWVIEEGARLFPKLIVAIGKNAAKRETFSLAERLQMLKGSVSHLKNVEVCDFGENEYLVHFARRKGADYILRGVRNPSDFSYEQTLRLINGDIAKEVTTVFVMPPRELGEVSSSTIKALIGPDGWQEVVRKLVTTLVLEALSQYD